MILLRYLQMALTHTRKRDVAKRAVGAVLGVLPRSVKAQVPKRNAGPDLIVGGQAPRDQVDR